MPSFRNQLLLAASAATLAAAQLPHMHQAGPQPGHTGAFGEPTCRECHFDYELNDAPLAVIRLDSLPAQYEPGKTYPLVLSLQHPQLKRGGFQLTARFDDGVQAGLFVITDTVFTRVQRAGGIQYLSHTAQATSSWTFHWSAPSAWKRVRFSVAANVSNADASEFGDRIYTSSFTSEAWQPKK